MAADQFRASKKSRVPILPISQCRQRKERRHEIRCNGHWHDQRQSNRVAALRIVYLFRTLDICSYPEYSQIPSANPTPKPGTGHVRRHQRHERIEMPLGRRDCAHHRDRQQNEKLQDRRHRAHHVDAADMIQAISAISASDTR